MGGGMGTVTAGSSMLRNTIDYRGIKNNLDQTGANNLSDLFGSSDPLFDKNATLPKEDDVLPENVTEKEAVEYLKAKK